ncbi:hypothetical protein MLD38_008262 [Melastoma candidum]|uniref:Uncharacterized protein n=2 Tax=Melastoma candidum TaxID=119954 RepID=A0ACB9RUA3_9MYRT|nr:hypothetical protein MLD38_008261 [Melastoma candidum]KAI4382281.1 hypothetical protein MLD38_008262 [Melastoma candidum]
MGERVEIKDEKPRLLTKLLLNVTIQGSVGAMHVVTVPDIRRGMGERVEIKDEKPRLLTKLLLNVTIQGSVGAMHVVTVPDIRRGMGERVEIKDEKPRLLTKLLLNVTIQGSVGAMHVVTVPDIRRGMGERVEIKDEKPRLLTKLLLNVTIQGSVGAMHVVTVPDIRRGMGERVEIKDEKPRLLTKLLLNVTIQGSVGAMHVVATLGQWKKSIRSVFVHVHVSLGGQKLVLGTLCPGKIPQLSFDLVFDKEFELSHNWTSGSVYFCESKSKEEGELELPAENGTGVKQSEKNESFVEPIQEDKDDSSEDCTWPPLMDSYELDAILKQIEDMFY